MRAAVPQYVPESEITRTPPGHRFGIYFRGWTDEWKLADHDKQKALKKVADGDDPNWKWMAGAIVRRQTDMAARLGDDAFAAVARSTAPFVTGMGYEHPLENGFAFLNPYGLPCLPGSSIKGVLRKAAEELVLSGEARGFDMLDVWRLFGFDGNAEFLKNHEQVRHAFPEPGRLGAWLKQVLPDDFRKKGLDEPPAFLAALPENKALRRSLFNMGALAFWDAFPQGKLTVEIMTPHHSEYLQAKDDDKKKTPHDSEKPNPIPFLAVAPGAKFHFFVQKIGDAGGCDWKDVLQRCFGHAFDWLGFGAKTSVGYGAFVCMNGGAAAEGKVPAGGDTPADAPPPYDPANEWLEKAVKELAAQPGVSEEHVWFGKALAERWRTIDDGELKAEVLSRIRSRWRERGIWDDPSGKSARKAKAIYEGRG